MTWKKQLQEGDPATSLNVEEIDGATYDDLQDWLNNTQSSGRISGGGISDNGNGSVTVAAGTGFIKASDSEIALTKSFDWVEKDDVALTDNNANYIYIDYNAGSPQILVTVDRTAIRATDQFIIGRVYRDGITLHILNSGIRLYNQVRQEHERLLAVRGFERASGGVVSETGERYLVSTAGVFYLGHNKITTTGKDTSGDAITGVTEGGAGSGEFKVAGDKTAEYTAGVTVTVSGSTNNNGNYTVSAGGSSHADDTTTIPVDEAVGAVADGRITTDRFTAWYYNGAAWVPVADQMQISNTQYNNVASGLANLAANRYGVHWIFIDYDSHLFSVYGQGSYKLANAENATVPSSIPLMLSTFAKLVAKVIIKKDAANFTSIVTAYETLFPVSTPPDHNDLGGIQGGAADDYYHLTSAELTGAQDAIAKKHTQGTDVALGAVGTKASPIDADKALYRDSEAADALKTSTWTQIKAFLKTYFDTLYSNLAHKARHQNGGADEISLAGLDGEPSTLTTHKGLNLSSSVHPNTAMCSAYLSAAQSHIPHAKSARVQLDTASFDPGSNFKNGAVFDQEQADANNCSATNIRDTGVNFQTITGKTNGLLYALVTWSSDAGGSANTGSGYVTAVTDANNLTIYKTNGANFANSYYYTIMEAWYKAPKTGWYVVALHTRFHSTSMVADKVYYTGTVTNGSVGASASLHSSHGDALQPFVAAILYLTADDLLSTYVYHLSGADTIVLREGALRTAFQVALLQEA